MYFIASPHTSKVFIHAHKEPLYGTQKKLPIGEKLLLVLILEIAIKDDRLFLNFERTLSAFDILRY